MKAHTASMIDSHQLHKWLSAVLSGTDTYVVFGKIIRDIKAMYPFYYKSKDSHSVF